MTTRPPAEEAGFSLVEALIALAIIAAMTLALLAAVIEDARGRRMMRERREALMVAQSALDNAVGGEGGDAGHWGRYVWHLDRDAYGDSAAFAHNRLEQLIVTVDTGDGHPLVRLATVRIVP